MSLLARGGVRRVIVEIARAPTILLVFLAVWRRERTSSSRKDLS